MLGCERVGAGTRNIVGIASHSPERRADKETDVLPELEEWTLEPKFVHDGVKDKACDDLYIMRNWDGLGRLSNVTYRPQVISVESIFVSASAHME